MPDTHFIKYPYTPCPLEKTIEVTALHTAFVHRMAPGYSSEMESHNFWELLVVLDGEVSMVTGENVFLLTRNRMLLHPPMEFHRHLNPNQEKNVYAVISFSADRLPVSEKSIYKLSTSDVLEFRAIIRLIREQYETDKICVLQKKPTARPSIDQEVKSRLEFFLSTALFSRVSPFTHTNQDYRRIVSFLTENLHRNLTLPVMAQELKMSVSNLKRVFSLYSGMGLMKYFNQLKFQKAVTLLEEGHSVREVLEMLSFSSQSVFSSAFKATMGLPPSKYRRRRGVRADNACTVHTLSLLP